MRAITIRNFLKRAILAGGIAGAAVGLLFGAQSLLAQPGQSPNFAWLRGAALGSSPALVCQGLDTNVNCNVVTQGTGTLLLNGVALPGVGGGAGIFSSLSVTTGPSAFVGAITGTPGTSGSPENLGGLVAFNSSADFTPATTGEEIAYTFTLPGNSLSANNQFIEVTWSGTTAANANNKRFRLYFGATIICDTTAGAFNGSAISARAFVYRTGAATQKATCAGFNEANGGTWATATGGAYNLSTPAETLSGAVVVKLTIQNTTAAADATARALNLVWYPAGQ